MSATARAGSLPLAFTSTGFPCTLTSHSSAVWTWSAPSSNSSPSTAMIGCPMARSVVSPVSSTARRALDQPALEQIGLVHVFDRVLLLPHGHGQRREPHRPPAELLADRAQDLSIEPVQALVVDLEEIEGRSGHVRGDGPVAA